MSVVSTDRSVRALLKQGIEHLRAADVASFTLAAELLLLHVSGKDRAWIYTHPEEILPDATAEAYFALIARRRGLSDALGALPDSWICDQGDGIGRRR